MTRPTIIPGSNITRHLGVEIADHVRSDVIAVLLDAVATLAARGCFDFEIQCWNGRTLSRLTNEAKSVHRGFVLVGGLTADTPRTNQRGTSGVAGYVEYWFERDEVVIDFDRIEAALREVGM
jgi:hypothetical protein